MFCDQCGTQIPENCKFCPSCGAKVYAGDMAAGQNIQSDAQVQQSYNMQNNGYGVPVNEQGQALREPIRASIQQGSGPQGNNGIQGQYMRMQPGQMPAKKKGSPVLIIILVVVVLVIGGIIAGIFVLKNKVKDKMDELGITGIIDDTQDMINGMTGNYNSNIKIPDGAVPVADANLLSLVGKYEGEFRCTALEGMENIPGAPADQVKEKVDEALSKPVECTLEIEDNGEWALDIKLLGEFDIDCRDVKNDDPKTPAEESAHLIGLVNGGAYNIDIKQSEEIDIEELGEGEATGRFVHTGVYCEKDGKNLIAGFMSQSMDLNGITVKVEGNFTVDKITGDYVPRGGGEATEEMNGETDRADSDTDKEESAALEKGTEENYDEDRSEALNETEKEQDTDSSGRDKAFGDPSQTAVRGGEWEQLESGEFQYYDKNNKLLTSQWAEDEGGYYYLGPDGCLVYNNYSHDGYWADKNGCWDPSVPKVDTQVDILNNTYVGSLWTLDVYMNDSRSGTAKWWYTNTFGGGEPKKYDFTIKQLGPSSYAAYSDINDNEIYLISVVDDGWSIIVSCDGSTDTLKIQ